MSSVMGTFYFMIQKKYKTSALFGILSLLLRQTNIIAMLYSCLFLAISDGSREISKGGDKNIGYLSYIYSLVFTALDDLHLLLYQFIYQIIVTLAFAVIIIRNGGVVLGDKEHHVASFNPAQPM